MCRIATFPSHSVQYASVGGQKIPPGSSDNFRDCQKKSKLYPRDFVFKFKLIVKSGQSQKNNCFLVWIIL